MNPEQSFVQADSPTRMVPVAQTIQAGEQGAPPQGSGLGVDIVVVIAIAIGVVFLILLYYLSRKKQKAEIAEIDDQADAARIDDETDVSPEDYDEKKEGLSLAQIKKAKKSTVSEDRSKEEVRELRRKRRAKSQTDKAKQAREPGEEEAEADEAEASGDDRDDSADAGEKPTNDLNLDFDDVEAEPSEKGPAAQSSPSLIPSLGSGLIDVQALAAKEGPVVDDPLGDLPLPGAGDDDDDDDDDAHKKEEAQGGKDGAEPLSPKTEAADKAAAEKAAADKAAADKAAAEKAAAEKAAAEKAAAEKAAADKAAAEKAAADKAAAEKAAADKAAADKAAADKAAADKAAADKAAAAREESGDEGADKPSKRRRKRKSERVEEDRSRSEKRVSEATVSVSREVQERPRTLQEGLVETRTKGFVSRLGEIFKPGLEDALLEQLEEVLFTADIGVRTSEALLEKVGAALGRKDGRDAGKALAILRKEVKGILSRSEQPFEVGEARPHVVLVVGVNGSGKTTTIGKLAAKLQSQGHKVLLVAGDTFRAAAIEQLEEWGERTGCKVHRDKQGADPSSTLFEGIQVAKSEGYDVVLADTAGRLHNKKDLVDELKKMTRVAGKCLEGAPHQTLLVLDATNGQNAVAQAKEFRDAVQYTGIILTKLDGTAKGGVIIGISDALKVPVHFIGIGEMVDDLRVFKADEFVDALFVDAKV